MIICRSNRGRLLRPELNAAPILFFKTDLCIHWSGINGIFLVVDVLNEITGMTKDISDLNQMVAATSEQSIVARDINGNIHSAGD